MKVKIINQIKDDYTKIISLFIVFFSVLYVYVKVWTHEADGVIKYVFLGLLMLACFLRVYFCRKEFIALGSNRLFLFLLAVLIAVLYWKTCDDINILLGVVVGFSLCTENFETIIYTSSVLLIFFLVLQIIGYKIGFFYDLPLSTWTRYDSAGNPVFTRQAFGFKHPNHIVYYILPIWCFVFFVKKRILKVILIVGSVVITLYTYSVTDSRTLLIISFVMLFSPLIYFLFKKYDFLKKLLIIAFPMLTVVSILFAVIAGRNDNIINKLLSSRPAFWLDFLTRGIKLLGSTDKNKDLFFRKDYSHQALDNYYLMQLVIGGIIFSVIFSILYGYFAFCLCKYKNYNLTTIFVIYLIYAFVESNIFFGTAFIYIPLFAVIFYPKFVAKESDIL